MKYTLHERQEKHCGVTSNLHGFLHRYLDKSFRTKWTGYWAPPYKFLDYYGIKVNGLWLDSGSLECTEYGTGYCFYHETDSLEIKEKVSTPDSVPGFQVKIEMKNMTNEKKAVQLALEPGIDIRHRTQDIGPEKYEIENKDTRITVSNGDKKLMISSRESFRLEGDSYTKEHYPGEKQRAFIPGQLVYRKEIAPENRESVEIEFATSGGSFGQIEKVRQQLDHDLGRTFSSSIDSLENLIYDRNGLGIIAGHPWFQNYWARDTFWSLLGLIDAGYFEISEKILENFARKDLPGKINTDGSGNDIDREDTEPLFIIAADKLKGHHGISEKIKEKMDEAMKELKLEANVVKHSPEGTWMDTLEREKAVDIQALWLEAAKIMDDPRKQKLKEGLEEFGKGEYIKDQLEGGPHTINPAVPLMFGQLNQKIAEKQLEKINGEFSSRFGARTRSITDPGYESNGYHTGSSWGLTTAWAATANFRYGKERQGKNFLEKVTHFLDRNQPGAIPEVADSENGENLGCTEQAWSAGLFVHAVDSYLLGIKARKDCVEIDPAGEVTAERKGKRVKGERLDLRFEDGEVEVLNNPDLELKY